eukprot:14935994-Heterocapsa_arctica.AAC.1
MENPISSFEARLNSLTNLCWGPGSQRARLKGKSNNHIWWDALEEYGDIDDNAPGTEITDEDI